NVFVGMSGGVDSSVAAALLKKEGYNVSGVIMEIFDDSISACEGTHHACFGPGEKDDVRKIAGEPLYVIGKDIEKNAVIVGAKEDARGNGLIAHKLNWLTFDSLEQPIRVKARIRFLHKEADAEVSPAAAGKVTEKFNEPQQSITPGQAVVFYDGDVVVGGGIIEREVKQI
ncbi:MAG: hypothetical protein GY765_14280, partial [bacterium]|nr:hypothetical protein [bacterium]